MAMPEIADDYSGQYDFETLQSADKIKQDTKRMANISRYIQNQKAVYDKFDDTETKPDSNGFKKL